MTRLEKWTLHSHLDSDGRPLQFLTGIVYGHPRADYFRKTLIDGCKIRTSKIVSLDLTEHIAVTQSGTIYKLGLKYKGDS